LRSSPWAHIPFLVSGAWVYSTRSISSRATARSIARRTCGCATAGWAHTTASLGRAGVLTDTLDALAQDEKRKGLSAGIEMPSKDPSEPLAAAGVTNAGSTIEIAICRDFDGSDGVRVRGWHIGGLRSDDVRGSWQHDR